MNKDEKIKLLINNKYMKQEDILSHTWEEKVDASDCLILKCTTCEHLYGLLIFSQGTGTKIFSTPNGNAIEMQSCNQCIMDIALS